MAYPKTKKIKAVIPTIENIAMTLEGARERFTLADIQCDLVDDLSHLRVLGLLDDRGQRAVQALARLQQQGQLLGKKHAFRCARFFHT